MKKQQQVYFSTGEVAQILGRSRRFVTKQVEFGKIKASRVSTRTTLIHQSAIDDWIANSQLPVAK